MTTQQTRAVSQLSSAEWDVQTCLQLLTGILKYSFARIPLSHAEVVIRSAAELVVGESTANALTLPSSIIGSPPLKSTPAARSTACSCRNGSSYTPCSLSATPGLIDGYLLLRFGNDQSLARQH